MRKMISDAKASLPITVFIAAAAAIAAMLIFAPLNAHAEDGITVTTTAPATEISIETTIPNVETSVPQQTQPLQNPETQVQEQQDDELPYETPKTDDEAQSLLDLLDINNSSTVDLILLITILSLAPSILVMLTCFTRIIISFSLLRNAMGVQQTPPNQVIMKPVLSEMNEVAYVPYKNGEYTITEAAKEASVPLKTWMLKNTSNESMNFFLELSDTEIDAETEEEFIEKVSFTTVVPAFILSEIKIGFEIGFLIYIPFLIVDIVVSTLLMSMGMMMLPPTTISIPFKILLFVLVDGWSLLTASLVNGFNPLVT